MLERLTKEQAVIVSGYTGILCCNFSDLHKEVERRLGRPVLTHEFPRLEKDIADAFKADFLAICAEGTQRGERTP